MSRPLVGTPCGLVGTDTHTRSQTSFHKHCALTQHAEALQKQKTRVKNRRLTKVLTLAAVNPLLRTCYNMPVLFLSPKVIHERFGSKAFKETVANEVKRKVRR